MTTIHDLYLDHERWRNALSAKPGVQAHERRAHRRGVRKLQALVAALGSVTDGQVVVVELTGMLYNGASIRGEDVVVIQHKQRK